MTFHAPSYYRNNPHVHAVLEWSDRRRNAVADAFDVAAEQLEGRSRVCGDTLDGPENVAIAACGRLASAAGDRLADAEVGYMAYQHRHAAAVHTGEAPARQDLSEWAYPDTPERDESALVYNGRAADYLYRATTFAASLHSVAKEFRAIAEALRFVNDTPRRNEQHMLPNRPAA